MQHKIQETLRNATFGDADFVRALANHFQEPVLNSELVTPEPTEDPKLWEDYQPISFLNTKQRVTSKQQALLVARQVKSTLLKYKVMTPPQRERLKHVTFGFGTFVRALAKYHAKGNKVRFSEHLLSPGAPVKLADFINTVKHELSHAVVGVREKHNNTWRQFFVACGGNGQRCGSMQEVEAPYSLQCVELKKNAKCFKVGRFVMPRKNVIVRKCCRKCRGRLEVVSTKTGEVLEMK